MTVSSRSLCQILALCVFVVAMTALLVEDLRPEPDTDLVVYYGGIVVLFAGFLALSFALGFVLLRLGTRDGATYWSTGDALQQVPRIGLLVGAIFCVQTTADFVLIRSGFGTTLMAGATGILAWTLIPATFMHFGSIRWPTRIHQASRRRLIWGVIIGLGLAATWSFTAFSLADTTPSITGADSLFVVASALIVAAAGEEIVFRGLLLTALVGVTGSRLQAVFISGVAFAAMHAPYEIYIPVAHGDWYMLLPIGQDYAGTFVKQVALGLGLGILWLRTGSITIVTLSHAVLNFGTTLANGY